MTTSEPRPARTVHIELPAGVPARCGKITYADTGEPVRGVVGVDLHLGIRERPVATITVLSPTVDVTIDSTDVAWRGLERVDTEALRAELERRGG